MRPLVTAAQRDEGRTGGEPVPRHGGYYDGAVRERRGILRAVAGGGEPYEGRKHGFFNATGEGGTFFPDKAAKTEESSLLIN